MSAIAKFAAVAIAGISYVAAQGPEAAPGVGCVTLVQAVTENNLGRLGQAVLSVAGDSTAQTLAGLATAPVELPEEQKVTIFAPEDAAWPPEDELPAGGELLDVLLGHVVDMYLPAAAVMEALGSSEEDVALPTLAGTAVTASLVGPDIYVAAPMQMAPGAKVIAGNIETCVGVIHVIDALLLGDSMAPVIAPEEVMMPAPGPVDETMAPMPSMDGPILPDLATPPTSDVSPTTLDGAVGVPPTEAADDSDVASRDIDTGVIGAPPTDGAKSGFAMGTVLAVIYTLASMAVFGSF